MGHVRKQMITFLTSAKCDLDCTYCYVPKLKKIDPQDERIDVNFAIAGMQDFFASTDYRTIRFFGAGEPTNAFTEIQEIYEAAHRLAGEELRVELQTNGYFSQEVGDWIEKHTDKLWISCDGPAEIHDKNRPLKQRGGSSDVVHTNIDRFSHCRKMEFGVRVTVVSEDFALQPQLIEFFYESNVKYVCIAPSFSSTANTDVSPPDLTEFARHFAGAFKRAQELGMCCQTLLMVNFDEEVDVYCRACTPCPQLTTDGHVSCCDWALLGPKYLPGPLQALVYGKWNERIKQIVYDQERIKAICGRSVDTLSVGACRDCSIIRNCAGGCIGKTIVITNDLYQPSEQWCAATRYLAGRLPRNSGLYPVRHS